jgi:hypothetical protein
MKCPAHSTFCTCGKADEVEKLRAENSLLKELLHRHSDLYGNPPRHLCPGFIECADCRLAADVRDALKTNSVANQPRPTAPARAVEPKETPSKYDELKHLIHEWIDCETENLNAARISAGINCAGSSMAMGAIDAYRQVLADIEELEQD